jgi:manganese efflux pump family protein
LGYLELQIIAFALAMDACAVCLASCTSPLCRGPRPALRLSFHFGLFQGAMPVVGWFLGKSVIHWIADLDHWIAFALLAIVALHMIRSGLKGDDSPSTLNPSRGMALILLSLATSIDAMAVGLSLAVLDIVIWGPAALIAVTTFALSMLAALLGNHVGKKFGRPMEIFGGILLIAIGAKIVLDHLLGS